jgi:SAM-dependent methyltransferase
MERGDWTRIAHEGLDFMGPYDGRHLERLFEGIDIAPGARVLDAGCGTGALLAWLASRGPIDGTGVDLRPPRRRIPGVRFVTGDVTGLTGHGDLDLACSIGAVSTPATLAPLVRPGGLVLFGGGYWRRRPSRAYLEALGAERNELTSWRETMSVGVPIGLQLLRAVRSSTADWDRYEDAWAANGERYAAQHAGERGVEAFRDWIRGGRRRYRERGGRGTLGFALLLWRRRR